MTNHLIVVLDFYSSSVDNEKQNIIADNKERKDYVGIKFRNELVPRSFFFFSSYSAYTITQQKMIIWPVRHSLSEWALCSYIWESLKGFIQNSIQWG